MKRLTAALSLVIAIAPFGYCFAQEDVAALNQAAASGDPTAQVRLGMKYALAAPRNVKEAMKWFRLAADQGFADGQYRLGGMYDVAQTPQNPTEAIKWYTLAAKQGHKDAQYRLGVMYDQGRGTAKDYALAAQWYAKAGEQARRPVPIG
jgi:TPR repeat protein